MHIIGISGKMCCGKSTTAQYIATFLNQKSIPTIRLGFGDPIKKEINELYRIPYEGLYVPEFKTKQYPLQYISPEGMELLQEYTGRFRDFGPTEILASSITPRELLQLHGTSIRRRFFGDNYWEEYVYHQIVDGIEKIEDEGVYIIDDIRHPTEIEMLQRYWPSETSVFRIHPYPEWSYHSDHPSETLLDDWADSDYSAAYYPEYNRLVHVAESILQHVKLW